MRSATRSARSARPRREERRLSVLAALGNAAVLVLLLFTRGWVLTWVVTIAGALRIAGIAWNIMVAPIYAASDAHESVISELGLDDEPEAVALAAEIEAAQQARAPIDRGWTFSFVATLFAIHIGRMGTDGTLLGLISPGVAVLGDMSIAVILTLLVIDPLYLGMAGADAMDRAPGLAPASAGSADRRRDLARAHHGRLAALAARLRDPDARMPLLGAGRAQQGPAGAGLPLAAIIAATVPVWGMSWYFDTENWAAGIWNSWAESRTDTWREAMIARRARVARAAATRRPSLRSQPEGIVRRLLLHRHRRHRRRRRVAARAARSAPRGRRTSPTCGSSSSRRTSSIPTGSMRDYEAKFWLPFKGVTKPVYAIPGNHDWYDALEGFARPSSSPTRRAPACAPGSRADLRLTSTTDGRIEDLVGEAARLRRSYGVPTGFQRAPFFEIQTDRFALVAIDTGVLRTIDPRRARGSRRRSTRAAGKLTMAILGHPFYAGGHDTTLDDEAFARLKQHAAAARA